jgi:hypothetical protein
VRKFGKGSGVAWAWQDKKALRAIRECFDGSSLPSVAIAVYVALTEIASDEAANSFETTLSHIAFKASCSVASVKRVLPDLESIPVVVVERKPRLKGPARYTLVAMAPNEPTIAQGEPTLAQGEPTTVQVGPTIVQARNTPRGATVEQMEERQKNREDGLTGSALAEGVQGEKIRKQRKRRRQVELWRRLQAVLKEPEKHPHLGYWLRKDTDKFERVLADTEREVKDAARGARQPIEDVGAYFSNTWNEFKGASDTGSKRAPK